MTRPKQTLSDIPPGSPEAEAAQALAGFVDEDWYIGRYSDIASAGISPLLHFIRFGLAEARDPNPFFDTAWYLRHHPDVAASGINPLLHYMTCGGGELRNPHPRFDAAWYAAEYPDSAANPLLYHVRIGRARGHRTEPPVDIAAFLPSALPPLVPPASVTVDVIIPVYRGLQETKACLLSVLADRSPPLGRIIVIEDQSPEPELVAFLLGVADSGEITLVRNPRNTGFVASVNRGMAEAGRNDVVLLNSDTEVPAGWLSRLAAQAYAAPRIASVSPFSNNATICGYPGNEGGPPAFGLSLPQLDNACRAANTGRHVDVPTTVGFCMYIRRTALDEVGAFDAERFPRGYGEENDFCLRATQAGWTHRLACDVFVYHAGQVSFGASRDKLAANARLQILARFPDYEQRVVRHVRLGAVLPYRFAITAELFRAIGLPVILMVSHGLGGGVRRHIDTLAARCRGRAHVVLIEGTPRGPALSVPALPDHPVLPFPADREDDLLRLLRHLGVTRVHVHHLMGIDLDVQALIRRLRVPFDTTVHDYYAICPQINLLPWRHNLYCGEPDIGHCNACIARSHHWARDIVTWRAEHAWLFRDAQRVLCPSQDVLDRLRRHGLDDRAVLAPHEPVAAAPWPLAPAAPGRGRLRIAVLGTLADHKGGRSVAAVAQRMDPKRFELHLIGEIDGDFPADARARMRITGAYDEADLPALIRRAAPHVIWFPMTWPETFSYTLSAAIAAGCAIAATRIGALPERLRDRKLTWLADIATPPPAWLDLFEVIRRTLNQPAAPVAALRGAVPDFYADSYLAPRVTPRAAAHPRIRRRPRIAVVPERFDNGLPTPCAYIRLLQPLWHPAITGDHEVVLHDHRTVLHDRADAIITQRFAAPDVRAAQAMAEHARQTGARLIYDLDDDLLNIPRSHPDARALRPQARVARAVLLAADTVWASTPALAAGLAELHGDVQVIENRLDERIWAVEPPPPHAWHGAVRILCMGTTSHASDFKLIEPVLARLKALYGDRVSIDVLGMTADTALPPGLNRIGPPPHAARSYPGFVQWLTSLRPSWDIGLAPLLDSPFNRCKSPVKALDYAALGLAVLASDGPVYRGSLADGPAGHLVANDPEAWFIAIDRLIRDRDLRRGLGDGAHAAFLRAGTLHGHAPFRRAALDRALAPAAKDTAA